MKNVTIQQSDLIVTDMYLSHIIRGLKSANAPLRMNIRNDLVSG